MVVTTTGGGNTTSPGSSRQIRSSTSPNTRRTVPSSYRESTPRRVSSVQVFSSIYFIVERLLQWRMAYLLHPLLPRLCTLSSTSGNRLWFSHVDLLMSSRISTLGSCRVTNKFLSGGIVSFFLACLFSVLSLLRFGRTWVHPPLLDELKGLIDTQNPNASVGIYIGIANLFRLYHSDWYDSSHHQPTSWFKVNSATLVSSLDFHTIFLVSLRSSLSDTPSPVVQSVSPFCSFILHY